MSARSGRGRGGGGGGIGVREEDKLDAAKEFLAYIGSEEAASELAAIGIMPAYTTDTVAEVTASNGA